MMDIVEQLRKSANIVYKQDGYTFRLGLQNEAADEIELLRRQLAHSVNLGNSWMDELDRMRKALQMWVKFWEEDDDDVWLAEEAMEATRGLLRDDNV